jgi:hypothetical protein
MLFLLYCLSLSLHSAADYQILFEDITASSGIQFQHVSGSAEKTRITDVNGSGAAFLDFDRDGLLDIYIVNGTRDGQTSGNALYRNSGNGRFVDVTSKAGVAERRWGLGVAAADYDNDGFTDLYIANYGRSTLYRNTGNGAFKDVTETSGVGKNGYSAGVTFADYDKDGWLDLFVTNYLDFDPANPAAQGLGCSYKGIAVFCGPGGFKGGRNILYRNRGDGTFIDVTAAAGVEAEEPHYSFTAVFDDFDGDGWPDLFVANDSTANYLYHNLGNGKFKEIGLQSGVAYSEDGRAQAGMGVAVRDYNNDGRTDILVTNFSDDHNTLYRNEGNMNFVDVSFSAGVALPSIPMLAWGALLEDFDNDGWPDAFTANGHIYPMVDSHPVNTTYKQWLQVLRNISGKFVDIGGQAGLHKPGLLASRAAVAGDIDNDGGVDVFVSQIDGPPVLLSNRSQRGAWLIVDLEGTASNRSAVGARIRVTAGALTQWRTIQAGGSYISQNDLRAHFGMAEATTAEVIEVYWPSGKQTVMREVPLKTVLKIRE